MACENTLGLDGGVAERLENAEFDAGLGLYVEIAGKPEDVEFDARRGLDVEVVEKTGDVERLGPDAGVAEELEDAGSGDTGNEALLSQIVWSDMLFIVKTGQKADNYT